MRALNTTATLDYIFKFIEKLNNLFTELRIAQFIIIY